MPDGRHPAGGKHQVGYIGNSERCIVRNDKSDRSHQWCHPSRNPRVGIHAPAVGISVGDNIVKGRRLCFRKVLSGGSSVRISAKRQRSNHLDVTQRQNVLYSRWTRCAWSSAQTRPVAGVAVARAETSTGVAGTGAVTTADIAGTDMVTSAVVSGGGICTSPAGAAGAGAYADSAGKGVSRC